MAGHKYTTVYNETTGREHGTCSCKDGYVLWPENGQCYRPFTRGPCGQGGMLEIEFDVVRFTNTCGSLHSFSFPVKMLTKSTIYYNTRTTIIDSVNIFTGNNLCRNIAHRHYVARSLVR